MLFRLGDGEGQYLYPGGMYPVGEEGMVHSVSEQDPQPVHKQYPYVQAKSTQPW
jgi:hypothetical protein